MAPPSSFSPNQLTWIIHKYGELKSVVSVMRAYRKQFYPKNPYLVPSKASKATCHTTANNLQFLADKFAERVISLKTEVVWPPNSPDCNPLDFFFWGYVMQHVYRTQPSTIDELKEMLKILFHLLMLT